MKKGEKYAIIKALKIFVHFNQRIFDFERIFALYGAPLWEEFMNELEKLPVDDTKAIHRHFSYPAGHALMGCRIMVLKDVVQFLEDTL